MSESFQRASRAATVVRLAATALSLVLAVTCTRDQPTAPFSHRVPTPKGFESSIPDDSGRRALESPATGTGHINVLSDGNYELVPHYVGTYPTLTVVTAHVSGVAAGSPWKQPWYFTEKGYLGNCGGYMPLIAGWSECLASRYIRVQGSVQMAGNWLPMPANCGQWNTDPCPTFSGGYDGELDRPDATIEIAPTDTTIHPGGTATIRWWPVPDSLGSFATPTTFERGYFDPDSSGGYSADSARACTIVGNSCKISPVGSGTLHLWVMANGQLVRKTAHIMVPALVLTASPASGHPGVQVTFTPRWSDGTAITTSVNWQWTPDRPPGQTRACGFSGWNYVCITPVYESGTMTVFVYNINGGTPQASAHVVIYSTFSLDADRNSVVAGDTVTFTPKYDGVPGPAATWKWVPSDTAAHDNTVCADGVWPCKKVMVVSGTMWAYTSTTAGQGDSASAGVTVQPISVTLAASSNEVQEGDTVLFTATVTPDRNYSIIGWTWLSDAAPPLAARSPTEPPVLKLSGGVRKASGSPSLTQRLVAQLRSPPPRPKFDVTADSDTVVAEQADSVNIPDDRPEPIACAAQTLTCTMAITKPGTITFAVNTAGTIQYRSAHVAIKYTCPPTFPTGAVTQQPSDPMTLQMAERSIRFGPQGTQTVTVSGPYTLLKKLDNAGPLGYPEAQYHPHDAHDDLGHTIPTPDSYVVFACRVRLSAIDNGVDYFTGKMIYVYHANIWWIILR